MVHDGLAVERGDGDKGYAIFQIAKGNVGKAIPLPVKDGAGQPLSLGDQVAWLEPADGGSTLEVKSVKGNKLVDRASIKGSFSGSFHTCRSGEALALATWAGHTGQHGAKPTARPPTQAPLPSRRAPAPSASKSIRDFGF